MLLQHLPFHRACQQRVQSLHGAVDGHWLVAGLLLPLTPPVEEPRVEFGHRLVEPRLEIRFDALELIFARLQMIERPGAITCLDEISQRPFALVNSFGARRFLLLLHVAAVGHLDSEQNASRRAAVALTPGKRPMMYRR